MVSQPQFWKNGVTFFLCIFCFSCAPSISEEEVLQRARASIPTWQNYQEDIKGQVGAGPVAEWRGRPVAVWVDKAQVRVAFQIEGRWATRSSAIPTLIEDPLGSILRSGDDVARNNGTTVYLFELPATETAVPWIRIKFPNGEKRIVLSEHGDWHEEGTGG